MTSNRQGSQSCEEGWTHVGSTTIINVALDTTTMQTKPTLTSLCDVLNVSRFIASCVHVTAPTMPPEARPLSDLIYLNKAEEDAKEKKSAHSMNTVNILNSNDPDAIHYCKNVIEENEIDNPIVELEALNAGIANYLCPDYTPEETYAFYDGNYKFVKITSRKILNFKSNQEDPLTKHNFILDIQNLIIDNNKFIEIQNALNESLQELSTSLDRSTIDENSTYTQRFISTTTSLYNRCLNPNLTADQCKPQIDQYLVEKKTDDTSLRKLLQLLKDRLEYIEKTKIVGDVNSNTPYTNEKITLEKAIDNIYRLTDTPEKIINNDILDIFDELEKMTKEKGINIDELNETERRTEKVFGNEYEFSVLALKNYSILKAMGYRRVLQKLENEGDDHNRNSGKKGGFDDDHKQEDVTYYFTKHSLGEKWLDLRRPKTNTFIFTRRDYEILPHSIDANPFYKPTEQIAVNKSIVDTASLICPYLTKNFFTSDDNAVYTNLATIPLFKYFKHQNTLKYILTDICIYENIHELHLRKAWKYTQQGDAIEAKLDYNDYHHDKTLLSKMNEKKVSKIQEVTNVVMTVPQFRHFLIYNGERALKQIKQEVQTYKDNLIKKLPAKPYLQKLIDAIDIEKFDQLYQKIYAKVLESTPQENYAELLKMIESQKIAHSQKMNGSQKSDEIRDSQKMVISQPLNNSCVMADSSSPEENSLKLAMT